MAVEVVRSGAEPGEAAEKAAATLAAAGFAVDYFEARHAETLLPLHGATGEPARLLVAARVGATRVIDNVEVW